MTEHVCKSEGEEFDCTTTYGSQRSPLDKEHANDVHCRFAGLEVESEEVGDKAYVGISISPNEHFERRKDLADYEDEPPVRKWYEEAAPEEFEELWSGVCEDDEMLEVHLVRSEIGVESAEVYKYKPVGKKVHPVPGVFSGSVEGETANTRGPPEHLAWGINASTGLCTYGKIHTGANERNGAR
jgi:hypothetical protein